MITIHSGYADDFGDLGLGILHPSECTITEEDAGAYELQIVHPADTAGRHKLLQPWQIIKAPAPVRETPLVQISAGGVSVTREIYKVDTPSGQRLRLRKSPSMNAGVVSKYKCGTEVIILEESGSWAHVIIQSGGAEGWMWRDYLTYVESRTESMEGDNPGQVVAVEQARDQLFRIYRVTPSSAGRTVSAEARHITYDLLGCVVGSEYAPENVAAKTAVSQIMQRADHDAGFTVHCEITEPVTGDYGGRNVLDCLLGGEDGIVPQLNARLVRDNYDIWILPGDAERKPGTAIRYGKNLVKAELETDVSDVITRIIPEGRTKDGDPLTGDPVDSAHIGEYPIINAKRISYDVKVGDEGISTEAQAKAKLAEKAREEFENNGIDMPAAEADVEFVRLEVAEEYTAAANRDRLHMYDQTDVIDREMGILATVRMVGYTWDCLTRRYTDTELGEINSVEPSVYGLDIAAGSIGGTRIMPGSITSAQLGRSSIEARHISADSVRANMIQAGAVVTEKLSAGAVTAEKIAAGAITAEKLSAEVITADKIAAGSVTADKIAAGAVTAEKIEAGAIDADRIAAGAVTAEKIEAGAVNAGHIAAKTITADSGIIADGAIGTAQIADGSITAAKVVELNADVIKAGTLSAERLVIVGEDGIIYRLNAASSGLTLTELEKDEYKNYINGTVIVAKSITAAQIAAQTITGNEILAGSITAKEIDVSDLFAAEATIQALNAMDITGNTYLKLMVTDAVDGVQVGGTNLIRNGGFYQGLEGWIKCEYDVTGDFRSMYVTGAGEGEYTPAEVPVLSLNAQNETGMFGATQTVYGLRKNTDYTISGYVASHRCNRAAIEIRNPEATRWQFGHVWDVGWGGTNLSTYDRFAYTFNTGDDSDLRITLYSNSFGENAFVWWAQIKLEEGDRATAWSPSPFDPADGVKTSHIEIADDHIDISSGGNVNIGAGSALNVNSGTFDVTTEDFSMSLARDDGTDVVMDIDDDGHTTFKAIHAGNVREAEYGYKYYDTASMGSLQAMADYLARTDARAVEYQMSADEYGHVTLKEYSGYFKIYAAGHKLPKITVANSFTGTLWISTGYLSSEGGAYGDKWALTVDGGNVFTTNCWFAPGTAAGIMVEYGGIYRWLNWKDLSTETGYTLDPFIYASAGGIAHVIGGIPAGGRNIWHGFIYEGAYLSEHGGTGGSGSTVSTASAAGTLGYYGSSNGWHAGECFQGYSNAKGRAYGCLAFDLSGVGTIQSAKLTLHRKSGVGLNRKANITVYGTTADRGSNPANGLTSAYVSAEGLIGWDGSATLDVTAAAQALKAGTIKQLVIYTGETGVYSGKAYSYHYAQFDSATLEVAYT